VEVILLWVRYRAIWTGALILALLLASCMADVAPRKSKPIPAGVKIQGIDGHAESYLGDQVPVFHRFEPDLGAFESLGLVNSSIHSNSCNVKYIAQSPDGVRAIAELRTKALALGADGLIDLECSVGGYSPRDLTAEEFRDFHGQEHCIRPSGEDSAHPESHEALDLECERVRDWPRLGAPAKCSYTTDCSAVAIKRQKVAP
jgi:hypothetical protein